MSILINKNTKVICSGHHRRHRHVPCPGQASDYGTQMVGGVTPGKGGTIIDGFPVFNTVSEAVRRNRRQRHLIYVPPAFAADCDHGSRRCRHRLICLHHRRHSGAGHGQGASVPDGEARPG